MHRYERSGVTSGLTRVRSFAQDDAHVFCTDEQVESEVLRAVGIILEIYRTFAFSDVEITLGTRPEKRVGADEQWDVAEAGLQSALEGNGIAYSINAGDGAFYGPKVDFRVSDALGRKWQLGTVQLDYQLPQRFDLDLRRDRRNAKRPVMIHRAMLGSVERFLGILIEHTAGAFPMWLAPVQVTVLPVSEKFLDYAAGGGRARPPGSGWSSTSRTRSSATRSALAQLEKVPFMLVVGEKEAEQGSLTVRLRSGEDQGAVTLAVLLPRLVAQAALGRRLCPGLPDR